MTVRGKSSIIIPTALILLFFVFLGPPSAYAADTDTDIFISEVQASGGRGKTYDEFIELFNRSDGTVNLKPFKLIRTGARLKTPSTVKSFSQKDIFLCPGQHYLWASGKGTYAGMADSVTEGGITGNDTILLTEEDLTVDSVALDGSGTPLPDGKSLVTIPETRISESPTPTPQEGACLPDTPSSSSLPSAGSVRINELFPNPTEKGEPDEWIELLDTDGEAVSLVGWTLRSGSGTFAFTGDLPVPQREIPAGGFLVVPRSLSKLALRNSDGIVTLLGPDGTTVMDSVTYDDTVEGASYGFFAPGRYRWSRTPTPGSENSFDSEPKTKKSSIPKKGYRDVPVPFSSKGNKRGMRYEWDFGDGHKSYLSSTSHTYEKTGTYHGTLTAGDGTEETMKTFTIRIEKYPKRKIRLTGLLSNPAGKDTGNEWVRIRNDDRKTIRLSGWGIATGTKRKKLVNHVVLSDVSVDAGKEIMLTNADARFTLPNGRGVVELRQPDGKAVQTVKYLPEGNAVENTVYADTGNGWTWIARIAKDAPTGQSELETVPTDGPVYETGMTVDPDSKKLSFDGFITLGTPYKVALPDSVPHVLGASDERLQSDASPSDTFLDTLFRMLNGLATGAI